MLAVSVVVHPLAPGTATDFAPKELTFSVKLVPELVVVVVYQIQELGPPVPPLGVNVGVVLQVCAEPELEESGQFSMLAILLPVPATGSPLLSLAITLVEVGSGA